MKEIVYDQIGETLYTDTLANGLTVKLLPKKDYNKTYAIFATDFGSIDNCFVPLGQEEMKEVPDGIAHFLEHKLFEKEVGDVFHQFSNYGAAANAFTSFTKTAYLFSTSDYVKENLTTLLDFVQDPYFTPETVNKEKGIIGQEIQMYDDDPNWRLMFGLLENIYPDHPVSIDIAGTVESIDKITSDQLYENYHTFYHPSNMTLVVVGQFDPEDLMALIEDNQNAKTFAPAEVIKRHKPDADLSHFKKEAQVKMDVSRPKVAVGIRGKQADLAGLERLKQEISLKIFFNMILGPSSKHYLSLYNEEIIDDSFYCDVNFDRSFNFISITSDTKHPQRFEDRIKTILLKQTDQEDFNQEQFDEVKRDLIGKNLQSLNSLEYIANQLTEKIEGDLNVFDLQELVQDIQLDDLGQIVKNYLDPDYLSVFKVLPK